MPIDMLLSLRANQIINAYPANDVFINKNTKNLDSIFAFVAFAYLCGGKDIK